MTNEGDDYVEWDAAYLLGALSPTERWQYEGHLALCSACSRSVAELAGLPALLSLVPADQLAPMEPTGGVSEGESGTVAAPDSLLVSRNAGALGPPPTSGQPSWLRLQNAARRQRRRTRTLVTTTVLSAAAALLAVALVLPGLLAPAPQPAPAAGPAITLSQVLPSALSAEVRLVPQEWGTRVEATCIYARTGSAAAPGADYATGAQDYALYVTDTSGTSHRVASWSAAPGSRVEPVGTTEVASSDITTVDIRSVATGQVLLGSAMHR